MPQASAYNGLESGDPETAALLFEDSDWRGAAHYAAEQWDKAADEFSKTKSADNWYNPGNALALAADNVCQSIAFPAISCGVYGYPAEEAAAIAIDACQDSTLDIHFYLFSRALLDAWQQTLEAAE